MGHRLAEAMAPFYSLISRINSADIRQPSYLVMSRAFFFLWPTHGNVIGDNYAVAGARG